MNIFLIIAIIGIIMIAIGASFSKIMHTKVKIILITICIITTFFCYHIYGMYNCPQFRVIKRNWGIGGIEYIVQARGKLLTTVYYNATGTNYWNEFDANDALITLQMDAMTTLPKWEVLKINNERR